jgi:hypothetical protein
MMAGATTLLERMTGESSSPHGPLKTPVGDLFTAFARSFWTQGIRLDEGLDAHTDCRVVAADQVAAFGLTGDEGWVSYNRIREAFSVRNLRRGQSGSTHGAKTSILPEELVTARTRLILRDRDNPLECLVTSDPIYPRRAWVGTLRLEPEVDAGMPFVLAGLLNSTLGLVLYHRLARERGATGHDLRKSVLLRILVPVYSYDEEAFRRASLLSYRLHCLHAADREVGLPASTLDEDMPNHRMRLLSELVRLYGLDDREARCVVEKVLRQGAADVLGAQLKLFYRSREALAPIRLVSAPEVEQYEALKELVRRKEVSDDQRQTLKRLQALLRWEHRANSPLPAPLPPKQAPGAATAEAAMRLADRYLSHTRGQSVLAEHADRISSLLWEVRLQRSIPPRSPRGTRDVEPVDAQSAGRVWVNAITGAVSDDPEQARDAAASRV